MTPITTLVTTGSSPVSLATVLPNSGRCAKLLLVAFAGNSDRIAVGLAGMNLTTGNSVINDAMQPGDTLSLESQSDSNRVYAGLYYLNSPTSGQKMLCTQWIS
ncbi:MAG: hypothetical protein ABI693_27935 [Bryobacteraceae bacterium]